MRILIACETSGKVRRAMMARGHDVLSCDLRPSDDNSPYHYQGPVEDLLDQEWDLLIGHPPCTFLTNAAAWCFNDVQTKRCKPGVLYGAARRAAREEAAEFALKLWRSKAKRAVLENPVGYLSRVLGKPSQIIQPYQFGDDASKSTCLWIRGEGMSPLVVPPEDQWCPPRIVVVNGKEYRRWSNQTDSGQNRLAPSADRWKLRSETYAGIAEAMAVNWG